MLDVANPWERLELGRADGVIVVDLLRATSTIQILLDNGCSISLMPAPPESHVLADGAQFRIGEWLGLPPRGADCGNSPVDVQALPIAGAHVEFISSNGSGAILGARTAGAVICASLFNAAAVVDFVATHALTSWSLLPAGSRGDRRIEDDFVCVRLAAALAERGFELTPRLAGMIDELADVTLARLLEGPGARWVIEHEGMRDIDFIFSSGYESRRIPMLRGRRLVRSRPSPPHEDPGRRSSLASAAQHWLNLFSQTA